MRWWPMIAQRFGAPELMERMLRQCDVDDYVLARSDAAETLRAAALRCMSCGQIDDCAVWLDRTEVADEPPSYCRNAGLIRRLRRDAAM